MCTVEGRERRLMYHRDLGSFECFEVPITVDDFVWDFVGRTAGTQVDTFILHVNYNLFPSRLKAVEYASEDGGPVGLMGDHATWASPERLTANSWRIMENTKTLVDANVDPIATLLDAAHGAGIDFFAGVRMNDVHHAQYNWHPRFWIEHPEYRVGDQPEYRYPRPGFREPAGAFQACVDDRLPACLDFIHDDVRAHKLAQIEEIPTAYEVDGIELDFTRHPVFFKPSEVGAGRERMTEFMAVLRKRLDAVGKRRGRPVALEVKTPPTLDACWRIGLDLRKWLGDNLVDIVVVGSLWHPDFGMPVEDFVGAAEGTRCKIFASFEFAEMPVLESAVETAKVIRAAALAYWKAGVAGIHLFNMHLFPYYFRQAMPFLHEVGDPVLLEYLDKHYMVTRASNYDHLVPFSYPKKLPVSLRETSSGPGQTVHLKVGDDLKKAAALGITADARLRLRLINLTSGDKVEVKLNGTTLSEQARSSAFFPMGEAGALRQYPFMADVYYGVEGPYHWLEFRLDKETMPRVGTNEIEVVLRKRNTHVGQELALNDVELTIKYDGQHK